MKVLAETFLIQKQGCTPKEQEDAAWPVERFEYGQTCHQGINLVLIELWCF